MGDACERPRAAHKSEFAQLGEQLEKAEDLLQQAAQGEPAARLTALAAASAELEPMGARAQVFVKRAQEKDVDKQMYGPKMVARVIDFSARLEAAVARAEELDAALAPLKALLQAQAQEEEEEREEARREREAEQARAAAAEAHRREEALVQQREASARREAEAPTLTLTHLNLNPNSHPHPHPHPNTGPNPHANPHPDQAARRREEFEAEREHERRGQAPGAAEAELGLEEALALLRRECADEAALADALQALLLLCANVVAHPEDQRFRTIRLLNAHFQATVARHRGGLEVLRALGFVERRSVEDDELCLVLEEPALELDLDAWSAWFDALKAKRDVLGAVMAELGVRPLPPAALGGGWGEAAPPPPAPLDGPMTMHGQHAGGM